MEKNDLTGKARRNKLARAHAQDFKGPIVEPAALPSIRICQLSLCLANWMQDKVAADLKEGRKKLSCLSIQRTAS